LTAGINNKKNAYLSNSLQDMKHPVLWDVMPGTVQSIPVVAHP